MNLIRNTTIYAVVLLNALALGIQTVSAQTLYESLKRVNENVEQNNIYNWLEPSCYACHGCATECYPPDWELLENNDSDR